MLNDFVLIRDGETVNVRWNSEAALREGYSSRAQIAAELGLPEPTDQERWLPTPRPVHDPKTQLIESAPPLLTPEGMREQWRILEITSQPQAPQWAQFSDAIYSNPVARAAMAAAPPLLGIRLGVGLGLARSGQPDDLESFGLAWDDAVAEGLIPPELAAALLQLAQQYQLPPAFINRLRGTP